MSDAKRALWGALLEDDWTRLNEGILTYGPVPTSGKVYVKNTLTGQMGIGSSIGRALDHLKADLTA